MTSGVLLFAHGARDPRWAEPFEQVARQMRDADASRPVELAFLEFMSPGLVEAGERLVTAGCGRVDVVPLFLGAGGHVRKDIPELLARLTASHPGVEWRLHPAVGETEEVVKAMARAAGDFARGG